MRALFRGRAPALLLCYGLSPSGFDSFNIGAVAGVDAHLVAYVAEKGNAYFGAGFHCGGFECIGGCVAF